MRAALPLALAILAASAAPAGAAIVPQDNIAGVKLGMTQGKVLRVLGDPASNVTSRGGPEGADPITTYTYKRKGVKVKFHPNRAGTRNVVFVVEVYRLRKHVMAEGIGLRSKRSQVKAEVPGVKCRRFDPTSASCWIGGGKTGSAITVFWLNARDRVESVTIAEVLGGDQ